jgi:hypothetical protein
MELLRLFGVFLPLPGRGDPATICTIKQQRPGTIAGIELRKANCTLVQISPPGRKNRGGARLI